MGTNSKIRSWALTVALAGFLFGFDTVVISGANLPIKNLWNTSPLFHGFFIMSMALWGTVLGSIFGGIPCDRWGRKKTLLWIGILYAVSALGSAFAQDPYFFSFFRFLGGVGVGASSVAAPIYLSEIAPAKNRGNVVAGYQFMLVFGIFMAFISNYLLQGFGGENDWRWMLGVEAVPALIYCALVVGIPNSPRWLILHQNKVQEARVILQGMGVNAEIAIKEIQQSVQRNVSGSVFKVKYNYVLMLAFLLAFFNQLSGINFILYYAPELLEISGLAAKDSLFSSISIGGVNLIFTLLGMYLIDRAGRKQLLVIGSIGYIISLGLVAYGFYSDASSTFLLSFILLFIASHAIGQGAIIWVFISEIFPTQVRAQGQSFGTATHWVLAAMITLVTPYFLDSTDGIFKDNPWPIFAFFAVFMVLQLIFALFIMPETKGKTLEELKTMLVKE